MATEKPTSMFISKSVSISLACACGLLTLAVWLDTSPRAANELAEEAAGTLISAKRPTSKEATRPAADHIAKQTPVDVADASASVSASGSKGREIQKP
jgi:hypothetical protein